MGDTFSFPNFYQAICHCHCIVCVYIHIYNLALQLYSQSLKTHTNQISKSWMETAAQHTGRAHGCSSTYWTPAQVPWSQPPTHLKSKGQRNRLMHTDLNDISAMTAHSYPFLTLLCLSAQAVIWQARLPLTASDCTRGRTRTDTASESYHTKGGETRCRCPREMWAP